MSYSQFEPATKPRGTVLVVPGRREFIEKKYTEVGQPLLDLGYRLIIVEPRGQGLSSRFLSGDERQRDHIDDFNTHINDIRAFYKRVVQPGLAKPLIVHGHSMGGHILLRWLAEDRPAGGRRVCHGPYAGDCQHARADGRACHQLGVCLRSCGKLCDADAT